jgi:cob(I)alamin adenosyltransferase
MKIYTKSGDEGLTFAGKQIGYVPKYDCSIDAQGEIDELNCWIGMIFNEIKGEDCYISHLHYVQIELMEIGAQLATGKITLEEGKITSLEEKIDLMTKDLPELKNFILPGYPSTVHVARAVCRRAERRVIEWRDKYPDDSREKFHLIIPYLNRLSDYLFTLARHVSKKDEVWKT